MKKTISLILTVFVFVFTAANVQANEENERAWLYMNELRGLLENSEVWKKGEPISRAEVAYILAQLAEEAPQSTINYMDVDQAHPYYNEIIQLSNLGIFTGYGDQTFRPDGHLSRAEMAKVIVQFFHLNAELKTPTFKDVPPNAWFYDDVEKLTALRITNGTSTAMFSPHATVTKEQIALFIYRIKNSEGLTHSEKPTISLANYKVLAGNGYGFKNGEATQALFRFPQGIVKVDHTYLIADSENNMIRALQGNTVTTYAGNGFFFDATQRPASYLKDGALNEALFQNPTNIVVAKDRTLFVADSENHVIRKITPAGEVTTYAGTGAVGLVDGKVNEAAFYMPQGLALADDGTLYVADTLNHVIRKIKDGQVTTLTNSDLRVVDIAENYSEIAGSYRDGAISEAQFNEPTSIVLDPAGNLYVSDSGNHVIRYVNFSTNEVSTFAGKFMDNGMYGKPGMQDGRAPASTFNYPSGLALVQTGELLVADRANNAIRLISNEVVSTISVSEHQPTALLVDGDKLMVVQSGTSQIGQYTLMKGAK